MSGLGTAKVEAEGVLVNPHVQTALKKDVGS
jgi:hypothetical protein